jgi:hypothetical protein
MLISWGGFVFFIICWVAKFMGTETNELYFEIIVGLAVYFAMLLLVPASVMGNAQPDPLTGENPLALAGGHFFLFVLWMTGWGFLWVMLYGGDAHAIGKVPMAADESWTSLDVMGSLPGGFSMWVKLGLTAYQGFQYSSFSFFPALPWKEVHVPESLPNPQKIMRAGLLEGVDLPFGLAWPSNWPSSAQFIAAVLVIPISLLLLSAFERRGNTAATMILIEVAFSGASFIVIKPRRLRSSRTVVTQLSFFS